MVTRFSDGNIGLSLSRKYPFSFLFTANGTCDSPSYKTDISTD